MINKSFTVSYRVYGVHHTVLGVTSIVPNLNGLLFFTEDGKNHQIESHEMRIRGDESPYKRLCVEYSNEEDIADEFDLASEEPFRYEVHDHRSK